MECTLPYKWNPAQSHTHTAMSIQWNSILKIKQIDNMWEFSLEEICSQVVSVSNEQCVTGENLAFADMKQVCQPRATCEGQVCTDFYSQHSKIGKSGKLTAAICSWNITLHGCTHDLIPKFYGWSISNFRCQRTMLSTHQHCSYKRYNCSDLCLLIATDGHKLRLQTQRTDTSTKDVSLSGITSVSGVERRSVLPCQSLRSLCTVLYIFRPFFLRSSLASFICSCSSFAASSQSLNVATLYPTVARE